MYVIKKKVLILVHALTNFSIMFTTGREGTGMKQERALITPQTFIPINKYNLKHSKMLMFHKS
jgi:hypothetical protein